ncbi:hypothetical protein A2160_03565 [Candidatus Beckwithbacteria bacterium RBG_13_42_9]|uniref:Type II secretion system protein GspG C-terminal domain-containing protein n=1 Tax=Candidatus Beckwithbacteria bacterium RBG_13_42_9 TaxID=1797457 RepID=A0A1F5E8U2_9BACT|nr:MAG: hypothetical protein A2160_03565 [Candidatus Beckwithbacteria bacterium RBG_13_42_9]
MKIYSAGFTLIELLVVVVVTGILAAIVSVAVNPARQLASARDTQRRVDLYSMTNAVYQFAAEHNGRLPDIDSNDATSNFPTIPVCVGDTAPCFNLANAGDATGTGRMVPTYIAEMPKDPLTGTMANTQYTIYADASGRIVASASAELTARITVTR